MLFYVIIPYRDSFIAHCTVQLVRTTILSKVVGVPAVNQISILRWVGSPPRGKVLLYIGYDRYVRPKRVGFSVV